MMQRISCIFSSRMILRFCLTTSPGWYYQKEIECSWLYLLAASESLFREGSTS